MYDTQVDSINVDDIAKNRNNRIVLHRLLRNNAGDENNESLWIRNRHYYIGPYPQRDERNGEDCVDYVPEGTNDMGWLGYFIGKNDHLERLYIRPFTPPSGSSVRDVLDPFFRGVSRNKSIQQISFANINLSGGNIFTMLRSFFQNNHNFTRIDINECDFGDEGCRLLALALGSCTNKSLKQVDLSNNNIADEEMVDIITALSMHPHLQHLNLGRNCLRKNGCMALATLLRSSAAELQNLIIYNNEINDDGLEALVPALANCNRLEMLRLFCNPSITTRGWRSLASILESSNSNLTELDVDQNNFDCCCIFESTDEQPHVGYVEHE